MSTEKQATFENLQPKASVALLLSTLPNKLLATHW